jgi:hypothetical protein
MIALRVVPSWSALLIRAARKERKPVWLEVPVRMDRVGVAEIG